MKYDNVKLVAPRLENYAKCEKYIVEQLLPLLERKQAQEEEAKGLNVGK